MADLDTHADTITKFYKRLLDAGLDGQVAGVCTIDLNKLLLSRDPPETKPGKQDQQDAIKAAAEQKIKDREARRAAAE